jgi:hypothetical protein
MRDHAHIPRRRLDADWLDYIFERMESRGRHKAVHLTLHVSPQMLENHEAGELVENIRGQLIQHHRVLGRRLRENFRLGRVSLLYGLVTLAIFMGLSELTHLLDKGPLAHAFQEGFLIIGWVALWRPVEILLYDWWPITEERKKIKRLIEGEITVNANHGKQKDQ